MIRKLAIFTALALTACTAGAQLYTDVVRSEMARNPEASYIDGLAGKLKWNYTTGLELKAMLDVYSANGDESILKYVDAWYDAVISKDGVIGGKYKKSNYSLDHICPGRTLFQLYDITGKEKYRKAMDSLYVQLKEQPRNAQGGFWHKKIYPDQMWLDGLYMAQPFYAEYTVRYVADEAEKAARAERKAKSAAQKDGAKRSSSKKSSVAVNVKAAARAAKEAAEAKAKADLEAKRQAAVVEAAAAVAASAPSAPEAPVQEPAPEAAPAPEAPAAAETPAPEAAPAE